MLSGGSVFLNLENVVINLSSLLCGSSRGPLENRLGQTISCLVAAGLGSLAPVQPPWLSHSPSSSRMKAPFQPPSSSSSALCVKIPYCLLLAAKCLFSSSKSYKFFVSLNWFLAVLDLHCCEQGLLSSCDARVSPIVEHGF